MPVAQGARMRASQNLEAWQDPKARPIVQIENVTKAFGSHYAVDSVSLEIFQGEFFSLLGASGCGKTTLLRMLAGLETPDSGQIVIDGADMTHVPPYRRPVNMMFQSYALFPHMTVEQNIAFGLKQDGLPKQEVEARVKEMLGLVQMTQYAKRKPHQLSGGQRQRVAMGRAIVRQPQVFLFDEPLSNLDAKLRAQTRLEIEKLHRELGITSLFVTHDQVEAMTLAERMIVMNAGRMEQFGTPEEVYHRPATTFVASFIGAPPMNLLSGIEGVRDGVLLGVRPEHLRVVDAGGWALHVETVEMLGAERLVYGHLGGEQGPWTILRTPETEAPPAPGQRLQVRPLDDRVHGFDEATGRRIEA